MTKYKVAIVSTGDSLNSILEAIDLENIKICALFGIWNDISESLQKVFKPAFNPLDMLVLKAQECKAEYFLVNIHPSLDCQIINKLVKLGIPKENIIGLWPFGSIPQFTYMYFLQWQYLINTPPSTPRVEFLVTGNSFFKFGIDLESMQPFNGVNFARDSQDIYYSFKMVENYLNMVKDNNYPRFCLIGLAPYVFNNWLDKTIRNFDQQFYFPIIGHKQMEYYGTSYGRFLETIFKSKYKIWLNGWISNVPQFDLNDIDGSRKWHQERYSITAAQRLKANDDLAIYERKKYPETVERNKEILNQFIELCLKRNVIPIGVLLPFSQIAQRHYPQIALREFFETLDPFLEKMKFINLWDMKLPDSYFEDLIHLKMTGALEVTKVIKKRISKILIDQ